MGIITRVKLLKAITDIEVDTATAGLGTFNIPAGSLGTIATWKFTGDDDAVFTDQWKQVRFDDYPRFTFMVFVGDLEPVVEG